MKHRLILVLALLLFCSHDMFFKPEAYFLEPDQDARIELFNGTFERSENTIDRNRMLDVSLLGRGSRVAVDSANWTEKDSSITVLNFRAGGPGTWVAGVSTRPRLIELAAPDFNDYLEHDGVLDELEWRRENNAMESDAVERYSKHVKTIFQVGDSLTGDWATPLGYPIEFIPLDNPYDLHPGHRLGVRLLLDGKPLADQLVYVGMEPANPDHAPDHTHAGDAIESHSHAEGADHQHTGVQQLRTDSRGEIELELAVSGTWYLRTIHMARLDSPELTHESNWATLTFAVGQGHSHEHAEEGHSHVAEGGIPSYVFWIGSLLIIAGLFVFFYRRK